MAFAPPDLSQLHLSPEWYRRSAAELAMDLLGKRLVTRLNGQLTTGRIVETEAYLPTGDSASHATRGCTPGNRSMFGEAGRVYVFPIHSRVCLNVVCGQPGEGTAVLIRAVQPVTGLPSMLARRKSRRIRDLCRGPGRLCQAFGIERAIDGLNLSPQDGVWIDQYPVGDSRSIRCLSTPRIGVTSSQELQMRFVIEDNPWVSGPARMRRA